MDLSQYKNIFGAPRTGNHAIRIFDFAVIDVIATLIMAIIISALSGWNIVLTTVGLFGAGIVAHRLFHVNTKLNVMIFGKI